MIRLSQNRSPKVDTTLISTRLRNGQALFKFHTGVNMGSSF